MKKIICIVCKNEIEEHKQSQYTLEKGIESKKNNLLCREPMHRLCYCHLFYQERALLIKKFNNMINRL